MRIKLWWFWENVTARIIQGGEDLIFWFWTIRMGIVFYFFLWVLKRDLREELNNNLNQM